MNLFILALAVLSTGPGYGKIGFGHGGEAKPLDINGLFDEIMGKDGALLSGGDDTWRIDVQSESSVYFFTSKYHFAYPSVIVGSFVGGNGNNRVKFNGFTNAEQNQYESWLEQVKCKLNDDPG